jgi:glucose/arabinose dehydrogenase
MPSWAERLLRRAGPAFFTGALIAVTLLLFAGAAQGASSFPAGFGVSTFADGFATPTAVAWAPDGRMFVTDKSGVLLVRDTDGTTKTLLDISDEVNDYFDRGLIGIAVDSAFASNHYVYLLYSHELDPRNPDSDEPMASRLTRVTVNANDTLQNPSDPETVILGTESNANCPQPDNTLDCIPGGFYFHSVGTVRSDPSDGTLWVGSGEAHPYTVNSLSYRPYDPTSFAGKLIHIDRNGQGLSNHPFCPSDTNLSHVCTKIYATGFRNPFRFTLRPGGGPAVADVGQASREELDLVQPGRNYGWPCYEGTMRTPLYQSEPRCQQEYAKEGTPAALTPPSWDYVNPFNPDDGAAIVAGPVYGGPNYPANYNGKLFVADYAAGWIKVLTIDTNDQVTAVTPFATGVGSPVDLETMPNGDLAYLDSFGTDAPGLRRITYANGNLPPTPVASATPVTGEPPLTVHFTGSNSSDPEGDTLTYDWNFGDGSAHSTAADPTHVYASGGDYTARLTVDDGAGRFPSTTIAITVGQPPTATITSPADGSSYQDGDPVQLTGTGTDPEDGVLPGTSLSWHVVLVHGAHVHDFTIFTGSTASITPLRDHDADSHYVITLTAQDSSGRTAHDSIEIWPQTIDLSLASSPPGAPMLYAGEGPTPAPFTRSTAIGFSPTIEAPQSFSYQDRQYTFSSWSDGGAAKHQITVPGTDATLLATYQRAVPPDTWIFAGPTGLTSSGAARFDFASDDPGSAYECSVDGGAYQTCSSPWQSAALADGEHLLFSVRAIDPYVGTPDPTPATRSLIVDTTAPARVRLGRTNPPSPARRNWFAVIGSAEPGSKVKLYPTPDCSGEAASGGPAELLEGAGVLVHVEDNQAMSLRAVAIDAAGNRSPCSAQPLTYLEDSRPPATRLIGGPAGPTSNLSPTFRFRASERNATFSCRPGGAPWRACASPFALRGLTPGRHVFSVRAIDAAGNVGAPARRAFALIARALR